MRNYRVSLSACLLIVLTLLISCVALAPVVHADTLQPDASTAITLAPLYQPVNGSCENNEACSPVYQLMGTITDASIAQLYLQRIYTGPMSGASVYTTLRACDDQAMTQNCQDIARALFPVFDTTFPARITSNWLLLQGGASYTFSPTKYYTFAVYAANTALGGEVWAIAYGDAQKHPYLDVDGVNTVQQVPSMVTNLSQYQSDGTTFIQSGAGFLGNAVTIKGDVSDQDSIAVALQAEVKPVGTDFDGTNLTTSATSTVASAPFATMTLSVTMAKGM